MTKWICRIENYLVLSTCWHACPYTPGCSLKAFSSSVRAHFMGIRMPTWKVLFIALLGLICLALAFATLIVPMTLVENSSRWFWLAGLLVSTVLTGAIFRLYMNNADRNF